MTNLNKYNQSMCQSSQSENLVLYMLGHDMIHLIWAIRMNGVKIWGIYRNSGTQFSELFYQVGSVDVICGQNTALAFI